MLMGRRRVDNALPTLRCRRDAEASPTRRWRVDVASAPRQRAIMTRWRFVGDASRRAATRRRRTVDATPTRCRPDADTKPTRHERETDT